jgi:O-antigen ligase
MLQAATFTFSAIGVLTATLAFCAALFVGWQRNLIRDNLVGLFIGVLVLIGVVVATGSNVNQSEGGLLRQSLTGLIYVLSFWFAINSRDGQISIPWPYIPTTLCLLVGLAFASALWSAAPGVTLRRTIQFAGVVVFAIAIVRSFDSDNLWRRYSNALLLWLTIGLVIAPFAMDFTFDADGNYRGLSAHKNSWAGIALAATILVAVQLKQQPRSIYLWASMVVALGSVMLTRSATAISLAVAILALGVMYRALQSRDDLVKTALLVLLMVVCTAPLVSLVVTGESPLDTVARLYFDAVQKEATLTGRNILWATILEHAWLSPWLGNGYGAFWIGDSGPSVAVVAGLNWLPVHSHNGYIDLFNDLGLVGLLVFSLVVAGHTLNILTIWRRGHTDAALLHLVVLVAVLGYNLSETSVMNATHALWVLLIVSVVDTHRLARQA